jgi:aromatic ring-opening dioxygenase LigB subunit
MYTQPCLHFLQYTFEYQDVHEQVYYLTLYIVLRISKGKPMKIKVMTYNCTTFFTIYRTITL